MERIKVAVRVAPTAFIAGRLSNVPVSFITDVHRNGIICIKSLDDDDGDRSIASVLTADGVRIDRFTFDVCYTSATSSDPTHGPATTSQTQVCEELSRELLDSAVRGRNTSLVAYGKKGTGKTYTLLGSPHSPIQPGVVQTMFKDLFNWMNELDALMKLELSICELVGEELNDLLMDEVPGQPTLLNVCEHPRRGSYVHGLSAHRLESYTDALAYVTQANSRRLSTDDGEGITRGVNRSSRSHVIFDVRCVQVLQVRGLVLGRCRLHAVKPHTPVLSSSDARFAEGMPAETYSRIQIVDLADRQTATIASEQRSVDRLNSGLNAFHAVIAALADAAHLRGVRRRSLFIPYRDSALTWLLRESFGGNTSTTFLATLSSDERCHFDSFHTLKVAGLVHKIINSPTVNENPNVKRIKELGDECSTLRTSLADHMKLRAQMTLKQFVEDKEKLKRYEQLIRDANTIWIDGWMEKFSGRGWSKSKELVESWKESQQRWLSSADSALGSDIEMEADIKLPETPENASNGSSLSSAASTINVRQKQYRSRLARPLSLTGTDRRPIQQALEQVTEPRRRSSFAAIQLQYAADQGELKKERSLKVENNAGSVAEKNQSPRTRRRMAERNRGISRRHRSMEKPPVAELRQIHDAEKIQHNCHTTDFKEVPQSLKSTQTTENGRLILSSGEPAQPHLSASPGGVITQRHLSTLPGGDTTQRHLSTSPGGDITQRHLSTSPGGDTVRRHLSTSPLLNVNVIVELKSRSTSPSRSNHQDITSPTGDGLYTTVQTRRKFKTSEKPRSPEPLAFLQPPSMQGQPQLQQPQDKLQSQQRRMEQPQSQLLQPLSQPQPQVQQQPSPQLQQPKLQTRQSQPKAQQHGEINLVLVLNNPSTESLCSRPPRQSGEKEAVAGNLDVAHQDPHFDRETDSCTELNAKMSASAATAATAAATDAAGVLTSSPRDRRTAAARRHRSMENPPELEMQRIRESLGESAPWLGLASSTTESLGNLEEKGTSGRMGEGHAISNHNIANFPPVQELHTRRVSRVLDNPMRIGNDGSVGLRDDLELKVNTYDVVVADNAGRQNVERHDARSAAAAAILKREIRDQIDNLRRVEKPTKTNFVSLNSLMESKSSQPLQSQNKFLHHSEVSIMTASRHDTLNFPTESNAARQKDGSPRLSIQPRQSTIRSEPVAHSGQDSNLSSNTTTGKLLPVEESLFFEEPKIRELFSSPNDTIQSQTATDLVSLFSCLTAEFNQVEGHISTAIRLKQEAAERDRAITAMLVESVDRRLAAARPIIEKIRQLLQSGEGAIQKTGSAVDRQSVDRLTAYRSLISSVDKFIAIYRLIQNIERCLVDEDYLKAVDDLDQLETLMTSLGTDDDNVEAVVVKARQLIRAEVNLVRNRTVYRLIETWNRLIAWRIPPPPLLSPPLSLIDKPVILDVTELCRSKVVGSHVLQAARRVGLLDVQVKQFADHLMSHFVERIATNRNTLLQTIEQTERSAAVITSINSQSRSSITALDTPPSPPPSPTEVFQKLEEIFTFLHHTLFDVSVEITDRVEAEEAVRRQSLMSLISDRVTSRMIDCIYVECLSRILSDPRCQWIVFNKIMRLAEQFETALSRLEMLPSGTETALTSSLDTFACRFSALKSREVLARAHDLLKASLADSVQVTSSRPLGDCGDERGRGDGGGGDDVGGRCMGDSGIDAEREMFVNDCRDRVGTSGYRMPTCRVSVTVRSLVCLAYDCLKEVIDGSQRVCNDVTQSVQNMLELYCDIVPYFNGEKLVTVPLLAALHHNNCMFIAQHLITVDKSFHNRLHPIEEQVLVDVDVTKRGQDKLASNNKARERHLTSDSNSTTTTTTAATREQSSSATGCDSSSNSGAGTLAHLVPKIRRLGNDTFSRHVDLQKRHLADDLRGHPEGESGEGDGGGQGEGFSCVSDEESRAAEFVQSVLRRLTEVGATWRLVLPENAYCKAIGALLNSTMKDIMTAVFNVSEFSVEDCEKLQKLLASVLETADKLFCPIQDGVSDDFSHTLAKPATLEKCLTDSAKTSSENDVAKSRDVLKLHAVAVAEYVPAWLKFRELVAFFGYTLSDVSDRWADGLGPLALHCSAAEVARLVMAMFENTSRRASVLEQLQRHKPAV